MTMKGDARKASYVLRDARCGGRAEALRGQTGLPRRHRSSPPPAAPLVGGPTLARPWPQPLVRRRAWGRRQGGQTQCQQQCPQQAQWQQQPQQAPTALAPAFAAALELAHPATLTWEQSRPHRVEKAGYDTRGLTNCPKRGSTATSPRAACSGAATWRATGAGSKWPARGSRSSTSASWTSGTATPGRTGPTSWSGTSMGWTCAIHESLSSPSPRALSFPFPLPLARGGGGWRRLAPSTISTNLPLAERAKAAR